jgi:hypothetical protein
MEVEHAAAASEIQKRLVTQSVQMKINPMHEQMRLQLQQPLGNNA